MSQVISVAIAVVEHENCFLVGQRCKDVPLGGLWEFPGGKIEENESPRAAAARECLEETGLRVEATHCLIVHLQQYDHGAVKLHFLACRPLEPLTPVEPPFQWITRDALAQLQFPVGNRPLLERLLAT